MVQDNDGPMQLKHARLTIEALSDSQWRVELESPAGTARAKVPALTAQRLREWLTPPRGWKKDIPPDWDQVVAHFASRWPSPDTLRRLGKGLAELLLSDRRLTDCLGTTVRLAHKSPVRLQIFLDSEPPLLAGMPIELLAPALMGEPDFPLRGQSEASDPRMYAVRSLYTESEAHFDLPSRPRVLIATAHQEGKPPRPEELAAHAEALCKRITSLGWEPVVIPDATVERVKWVVNEGVDILYLLAHGSVSAEWSGLLALRGSPLSGTALRSMLKESFDRRRVQLVLLAGCSTAQEPLEDGGQLRETSSMARFLVQSDKGAIASMGFRHQVPVDLALSFMTTFFTCLQEDRSLASAFARARALIPEEDPCWLLPQLYVRRPDPLAMMPTQAQPLSFSSTASALQHTPEVTAPAPQALLVGRNSDMQTLEFWLDEPEPVPVCVLLGAAGVGKTELAKKCAAARPDMPTVWVERPEDDLRAAFAHILRLDDPSFQLCAEHSDSELEAQLRLRLSHPCGLLILDDVEKAETVARLTPGPQWHVLVTTRGLDAMPKAWVLEVRRLNDDESVALLSMLIFGAEVPPPEEAAALKALAHELEGLPLALELAGKQISRHLLSAASYVAELCAEEGHPNEQPTAGVQRVLARSLKSMQPEEARCFEALGTLSRAGARLEEVAETLVQPEARVLAWLERLVRQGLVRHEFRRALYSLHSLLWASSRRLNFTGMG